MADLILGSTTVMSESGGVISGIPAAGITGTFGSGVTFPAGHVVKVYYDTDSTTQTGSQTAHTWYNSLLSITLTPVSINSKFVIQGHWSHRGTSNGSAMKIVRDGATEPSTGSTLIGDEAGTRFRATLAYSYEGFDANQRNQLAYSVHDDPDTALELTYRLQYMTESTSYYINRNENYPNAAVNYAAVDVSTMTIFEISS